jgi:hypothetical protein
VQNLTLLALGSFVLAPYLASLGLLPGSVKFLPEMFSGLVAVYVLVQGISTRFKYVRTEYWLVFGAAATVLVCGVIANSVSPGPILSGMRYYARAIPFFFLPLVYPFSEDEIWKQMRFLCGIALLQLPLAVYQKYELVSDFRFTGDFVFGTLMLSSSMTLYLIVGIGFLIALYLRKSISPKTFAILFALFVLPTALNETKVTIFFMPVGIMMTALIATPRGQRMRIFLLGTALVVVAGAIFVPIFNYLGTKAVRTKEEESKITDMFTKKDFFEKYLNQNSQLGDRKEVGRVDGITVPVAVIARDPISLVLGLGLGNASSSNLGPQFSGKHAPLLARYASGGPSAGAMILEVGLLGVACALLLHWMILRDALIATRTGSDLVSQLAGAWPAAVALMTVSLFYVAPISSENQSYLFWYFSGVFVARRAQLAVESTATARSRRGGAMRTPIGSAPQIPPRQRV